MKLALFGHTILWRGLCKALAQLGHRIVFFEHDAPYYAQGRDGYEVPGGELVLYESWVHVEQRVARELHDSDAAIVTSYCPDALRARDAIAASGSISIFYDLDTPVTLARMHCGEHVPYLDDSGLASYDLVLSCTGGGALDELRVHLGARRVRPLYGHVDPELHHPVDPGQRYCADVSWLGSYARDRQQQLEELFIEPARRAPQYRFLIGGAHYPRDSQWTRNVFFARHVPPDQHAAFFCSSRLTLNVTREAMARMGWCPSGRLFEAAACGAAIVSDEWSGLEEFYEPDAEILLARDAEDMLAALALDRATLERIGRAARERTLAQHTSAHRARLLLRFIEEVAGADARQSGRRALLDTDRDDLRA